MSKSLGKKNIELNLRYKYYIVSNVQVMQTIILILENEIKLVYVNKNIENKLTIEDMI